MSSSGPVRIHYHRDFDGMVSAAVLATALRETRGETPAWSSVNYDQRSDWDNFSARERFAIVDFHFHPRAEYWFDHHPTTFLTPELRSAYAPSERWQWDESWIIWGFSLWCVWFWSVWFWFLLLFLLWCSWW